MGGGVYADGNITLIDSNVSSNSTTGIGSAGGGIFAAGNVILTDSSVALNNTTGDNADGGGIRANGDVTLNNSNVSVNSTTGANSFGGAIRSRGDVTLNNSSVILNSTAGVAARGGGISADGNVTLAFANVIANSTQGDDATGGGIHATGDVIVIADTEVTGNTTQGDDASGGGFYAGGDVTLNNSTVSENSTVGFDAAGGGILSRNSVTLSQSTVSGNSTAGSEYAGGGGIYAVGAVTLTHSTVSGNSTAGNYAVGGGILSYGPVTLSHSTVTANHTDHVVASAGGIWNFNDPIIITNSIVANNSAAGGMDDINPGTGSFNVNFSLIEQTGLTITGSDNLIGALANLGPLASNGGPTQTHALLAGSLAIDAGDPAIVLPPPFDQRGTGFDRIQAGRIDIGAFELQDHNQAPVFISPATASVAENTTVVHTLAATADLPAQTITFTIAGSGADNASFVIVSDELRFIAAPDFENPTDLGGTANVYEVSVQADDGNGGVTPQTILVTVTDVVEVLQTYVVDIVDDEDDGDYSSGDLSLREAIGLANSDIGANTITFDASLAGNTITLGGTELEITEAVTIDATALANNVSIDANNASRIFNITATTGNFTLAGLTVTGGRTIGDNSFSADTTFDGGAIRSLTTGNLTIDQSTVSNNNTMGKFSRGGGIRAHGDLTLTSSTVSGNSTAGQEARAGGVFTKGSLTLTNSTVSGNSTTGFVASAGGIYSFGTLALTNSTVSGNSTTGGFSNAGGIVTSGAIALMSSTITDNHAYDPTSMIGGIVNNNDPIAITNSILAGNTAGSGSQDIDPGTGAFTVNFSLLGTSVSPDAGGNGNIFDNTPSLSALANNGGPTETHALLAGSPAIDAGDPSIVFNPAEFDQRGAPFARVAAGRIDIGAIEDQPLPDSADFDTDGDVDGSDFLAWQRGFGILSPNANPTDGDANGDQAVDGVDLGIWESQFGLGGLSAINDQPSAFSAQQAELFATQAPAVARHVELIDAAMAIALIRDAQVEETPSLDGDPAFSETYADHAFAAEEIAPAAAFTSESEPTEPGEDEDVKDSWLADELLERVFG